MSDLKPPFQFDLGSLLSRARQKLNTRVGGIAINLPFVSFNVHPDDVEQRVAREIVIRMSDRRVLNAFECCDNCIDNALASLQEMRTLLVDKQVDLAKMSEGVLYLLLEFQLEAIRQFLTFEQRLRDRNQQSQIYTPEGSSFRRPHEQREVYFAGLEMLRAHLFRCLSQVAAIAQIKIPKIADNMRYGEAWQLEAYKQPKFIKNSDASGDD